MKSNGWRCLCITTCAVLVLCVAWSAGCSRVTPDDIAVQVKYGQQVWGSPRWFSPDEKARVGELCMRLMQRWSPSVATPRTVSAYWHYCRMERLALLGGYDCGTSSYSSLAAVLDMRLAKRLFGESIIKRTRYGLRYQGGGSDGLGRAGGFQESHRDQVLLALASSGYRENSPIVLEDGSGEVLGSVYNDMLANAVGVQAELPWTAKAMTLMHLSSGTWTDKFGQLHHYEEIILGLLTQLSDSYGCRGVHVLDALICCANGDGWVGLSAGTRTRVTGCIAECRKSLADTQLTGGGWNSRWLAVGRQSSTYGKIDELLLTGHLMELVLTGGSEWNLSMDSCRRALFRLSELLAELEKAGQLDDEHLICPAGHAVCALLLAGAK